MTAPLIILTALAALLIGVPVLVVSLVYAAGPVFRAVGWLLKHVFGFLGREIADVLRIVGGIITSVVLVPLVLLNVLLGRWSSAGHYGRAMEGEAKAILHSAYRVMIGHPARLLMLTPLTEGIEQRIPVAFERAPGPERPTRRQGQFEGYTIVGSLPGGGSGAKLYIAEPTARKRAELARSLQGDVGRVVIKCFSVSDGSTLPQIVRENRALPAARRQGLILEHELTDDRFFYVTRYVPGEPLTIVTQRLHAMAGGGGLSGRHLGEGVSYVADLLRTLDRYHAGGLWHKDVKPDNIIVSGDGRAHLVDFGLVTPLRANVTLTTHGTEYFRDPEMVRMALRGVKVHEVDGARFDLYAAGACLFSVLENSFPAHGGLSAFTRRCPEALKWVVRRAMTDYDKRYATAAEMLADVETVLRAEDPFALRPADLPSVRLGTTGTVGAAADGVGGAGVQDGGATMTSDTATGGRAARAARGAWAGSAVPPPEAGARPRLKVTNWWTGKYSLGVPPVAPAAPAGLSGLHAVINAESLGRARAQARDARERARERLRKYRDERPHEVNRGVVLAVLALMAVTISAATGHGPGTWFGSSRRTPVETPAKPAGPEITVAPPAAPKAGAGVVEARAAGETAGPRTRALVLKDSLTFAPDAQKGIDERLHRLEGANFELLGLATTASASPEAVDRQTGLVAELRAALSLSPFRSGEAAAAIRGWLAEHDEVDLVVWVDQGEDARPAVWVVDRTGKADDAASRARAAMEATPKPATDGRRGRGHRRS